MIKLTMTRTHDGLPSTHDSREEPPGKALEMLIIFEIGYGGRIIEISETSVSVQTQVMGCVDVSKFEGSVDEMRPLVEAAALCIQMDGSPEWQERQLDIIVKATKGNPRLIALGGEMFAGEPKSKAIALTLLVLASKKPQAELPEIGLNLVKTKTKDLVSALGMINYEGVSFADAVSLLV